MESVEEGSEGYRGETPDFAGLGATQNNPPASTKRQPESQLSVNHGSTYPRFELIEFNTRRLARRAEAARVLVSYSADPEDVELLWMSKHDVQQNLKAFGWHVDLDRALDAYRRGTK